MKKEGIQTRRRKSKKSKSPKKGSLEEAAAIVAVASLGVGSNQQFDEKSKYFINIFLIINFSSVLYFNLIKNI